MRLNKSRLVKELEKKHYEPTFAAEIGVFSPEVSVIYFYIINGIKSLLVEPDGQAAQLIIDHFLNRPNVTFYPIAISDHNGKIKLAKHGASTFISTLKSSPAIVNDNYELAHEDEFVVQCKTFDQIDEGTIDLISIDIEGAEWYVLKNMRSRPHVISIETHGGCYLNPYLKEIKSWMKDNHYAIFYKDKSDSVYVQPNVIKITVANRFNLAWINIYLALRRKKKQLFNCIAS